MTREEAIQWLKEMKDTIELYNDLSKSYTFDKYPQAIDMAISALHFEADCRSCMWREKYEEQTEPSDLISHEEAWKQIESDLISRAEAIEAVREVVIDNDAVEALKALPSADRPTEDYSDLPDIPRAYYEKIVGNMSHEINMLKQQLEDRPMVHSERPAEWIRHEDYGGFDYWECSNCKEDFYFEVEAPKGYNYCPSCGAFMKGGAE